MSFNPLIAKVTGELSAKNPQIESVVELGNQTFNASPTVLKYVQSLSNTFNQEELKRLSNLSKSERSDQTANYYKAIRINSYTAIDINEKYGSLAMDLNYSLKERYEYNQTFDLVTNNGTGEHIFNQASVFENMHNLTKKDGYMIHIMPFVNWQNHGFYNFHPILYLDIAHANQYELISLGIGEREGKVVIARNERLETFRSQTVSRSTESNLFKKIILRIFGQSLNVCKIYVNGLSSKTNKEFDLHSLTGDIKFPRKGQDLSEEIIKMTRGNPWANLSIISILKKQNDLQFRYPIQGKYFQDITDENIDDEYRDCH